LPFQVDTGTGSGIRAIPSKSCERTVVFENSELDSMSLVTTSVVRSGQPGKANLRLLMCPEIGFADAVAGRQFRRWTVHLDFPDFDDVRSMGHLQGHGGILFDE
jgi:hypothetical protein